MSVPCSRCQSPLEPQDLRCPICSQASPEQDLPPQSRAFAEVLRCDDCVDYHLVQCVEAGFSDEELHDALNVGLVVGGSIVIPHLRHAVATIDALRERGAGEA